MLSQFSASGLLHPLCRGGGAIWPGVPEPSAAGKKQKAQLKETRCPVTSRSVDRIDLNLQVLVPHLSVALIAQASKLGHSSLLSLTHICCHHTCSLPV